MSPMVFLNSHNRAVKDLKKVPWLTWFTRGAVPFLWETMKIFHEKFGAPKHKEDVGWGLEILVSDPTSPVLK